MAARVALRVARQRAGARAREPRHLWRAPLTTADDAQLISTYRPCGTGVVVYGHTQLPFVRRVGDLTVANSGSVGSPFDGNPRPSYLLIASGEPEVVRVE